MVVDPAATYELHAEPTGQGILDKMTELGDEPSWTYSYGGAEFAMTMGKSGRLYIFDAVAGIVRPFLLALPENGGEAEGDGGDPWGFWSAEQIAAACGTPERDGAVRANWPAIYGELAAAGCASRESLAAAIGTVAIETANTWRPVREAFWVYDKDPAAAYAYYSDTTKHAAYHGGPEFHGRGYVQTTHDYNYERVLGPAPAGTQHERHVWADQLMEPGPAAHAFASYWASHGSAALAEAHDWKRCRGSVVGQVANPPGWDRLAAIAETLLGE